MPERPHRVILLIVDSLRFDSTIFGSTPYLDNTGRRFTQARSAGCWTLPATASLFTGLLPHEHGATSLSRQISTAAPTLAQRLSAAGYQTVQLTANEVTAGVYGLDRGFHSVIPTASLALPEGGLTQQLAPFLLRPRVYRRLMKPDLWLRTLGEDLEASRAWVQSLHRPALTRARALLNESRRSNKRLFLFINLMECHFPYHIDALFRLVSQGLRGKARELRALHHMVDQTWLKTGRSHHDADAAALLRARQGKAWERLAPALDAFVREVHGDGDTLAVVCGDHGDCFGEEGWLYHFSNVTDGGTRVPMWWLAPQGAGASLIDDRPVSTADVPWTILSQCGLHDVAPLLEPEHRRIPILQSHWYDRNGQTLPRYRVNQFCFIHNKIRYRLAGERWWSAPIQTGPPPEPPFEPLPRGVDPIEEHAGPRAELRRDLAAFRAFSKGLEGRRGLRRER